MSLKAEDCTGNLEGLDEKQLKVLDDWQRKFDEKYPFVGRLDD
jgi:membrane-associated progesterone receptor component